MTTNTAIDGFQTGHVGLNVSDIERSKQFYREVFGFDVMAESREEGKRFVLLSKDQKLVLTLWQQSVERFNKGISGLHHLSFQVETIGAVQTAEQKLKQIGAKLIYDRIVAHGEGAQSGGIYFEDPDGIRLEIYAPMGAGEYTASAGGAPSCGFF
ncbi:MAG: VOC family protein [Acidobacteria bacterium]|nr:VOC family protein [Acidobacteriota bacterium]